MLQVPLATVPVQLSTPSLTVTLPVGVPAPGATAATVKFTVTACPASDGSGVSESIVVVVSAGLTVCASAAEVLPLKLLSPAYVAVRLLVPALVKVSEHCPAATVPVQEIVPSLTVTLPVGVPGLAGVTLYCTVTDSPTTEGSGLSEVIAVVVAILLTVCGLPGEVLLL